MSWTLLSAHEVHELIASDNVFLIDVRTEIEFSQGHPAGSYNIPWMLRSSANLVRNTDFIADVLRICSREDSIILSCKSGNRSSRAAAALQRAGFSSLYELKNGFEGRRDSFGRQTIKGWKASGLPIGFDAPLSRTYHWKNEELS